MKKHLIGWILLLLGLTATLVGYHLLRKREAVWLQGTVAGTSYRAASKLPGRVLEIYVREGERVDSGAPLYRLSTSEVEARLKQALGAEQSARALDEQALKGARPEQREEALQMWQRAQAGRQLATQSFERLQRLYSEGVISAQQYDEGEANYHAAVAMEEAARAAYELVLAGASSEERAAAAGGVTRAEGAVEEVESYLEDGVVVAPQSGEVAQQAAEVGELVPSGFPLFTILDLEDCWVNFYLYENLLPQITLGSRMQGYLPALGRKVELQVSYIAPEADFALRQASRALGDFDLRSFQVKARPTKPEEGLRPGMSVLVNLKKIE